MRSEFMKQPAMESVNGTSLHFVCTEYSAKLEDNSVSTTFMVMEPDALRVTSNGKVIRSGKIQNKSGIVPEGTSLGSGITEADVIHSVGSKNVSADSTLFIEHIVRPAVAQPAPEAAATFAKLSQQYETALSKDLSGNSLPTLAMSYATCHMPKTSCTPCQAREYGDGHPTTGFVSYEITYEGDPNGTTIGYNKFFYMISMTEMQECQAIRAVDTRCR